LTVESPNFVKIKNSTPLLSLTHAKTRHPRWRVADELGEDEALHAVLFAFAVLPQVSDDAAGPAAADGELEDSGCDGASTPVLHSHDTLE